MSSSILSVTRPADLRRHLEFCSTIRPFSVDRVYDLAVRLVNAYRTRAVIREAQEVERRWYLSVADGMPDYSVYDDEFYLAETWACWVMYSRRYLLGIASPKALHGRSIIQDIGAVRGVLDVGCGHGFTTAALAELFPSAEVIGTNVRESLQWDVATAIGKTRRFKIKDCIGWSRADVLFASEYFEHFREPVAHLCDILRAGRPRAIILANSFTGRAVGHFPQYIVNGSRIPNTATAKYFHAAMRDHGYTRVDTNTWNGRPAYWRLAGV